MGFLTLHRNPAGLLTPQLIELLPDHLVRDRGNFALQGKAPQPLHVDFGLDLDQNLKSYRGILLYLQTANPRLRYGPQVLLLEGQLPALLQ